MHRGFQGWTHCRIPDTHWGITSGMGMLSGPASSHQFPPVRTVGVIGIQPLTGVLPVDTSSHIPELVRSLVWRPGGGPPPGHQTEVHDPLVTSIHVLRATTGGSISGSGWATLQHNHAVASQQLSPRTGDEEPVSPTPRPPREEPEEPATLPARVSSVQLEGYLGRKHDLEAATKRASNR